jgi:biopolymer transport protein ExbD
MAISVKDSGDDDVMSDINVTPLVDVMLVLLIIFIITVPVVIQTVRLELPKVTNLPTTTKPENLNLSTTNGANGCEMYIATAKQANTQELRERAAKFLLDEVNKQKQRDGRVHDLPEAHIRVDANAPFRCAGGVVFALQTAGFQKIGFISEPPAGFVPTR